MAWLLPPLPPKFEAALRDVHGKRIESRLAAAERLGRADDEERTRAVEGLITLCKDEQPAVRATALAALGGLGAHEALHNVLDALHDESPQVRELAAVAAGQIGGETALAAMREALHNPAPEVRFQAVCAVAELAPREAARELLPLLTDPDPEVRAQVVLGLSSLNEPHLAGHFAGALEDPSPEVRLEAALALAALDDARGERELLRALDARERLLEVPGALAELGSEHAVPRLAQLSRSLFTPPHARAAVGAALHRLGDPRGVVALRRVLSGLRADARSYAVELVGESRAVELLPELLRLTARPRGADLVTLIEALSLLSDEPAAREGLTRLAQRADDVGERARDALRTGSPPGP